MKSAQRLSVLLLTLAATAALTARADAADTPDLPGNGTQALEAESTATPIDKDWTARKSDNICGLSDLSKVSYPAVLDYEKCLTATPEMKKIRDDGIDQGSAKGIQLKAAAATRVGNAADTYRKTVGFCSVWKSIKHKDGRQITDITEKVIAQY